MAQQISTIENGVLKVSISNVGATVKSVKDASGEEFIWRADPQFWAGSAPILFPICGGLNNDTYRYNRREYKLGRHGYIRFREFEVYEQKADEIVFLSRSDEETLACYPFEYELFVRFKLDESKLSTTYTVKNKSGVEMYFSIGAHEGYYCPEGIEEYDVILPEAETLYSTVLEGNVLGNNKVRIIENSDRIALKYDYFAVDALVFKDMKARSAVLKNRNNGKAVKVTFEGCDYFLLWTKPDAPYICLEPWCGISDNKDTDKNFKTKEGIRQIAAGGNFVNEHSIEVLDNGGK